jgi:MFS family permease
VPYFIAGCFSFATACSKDIQAILITRFFAGIFGSAPVTNTGGVLGDIWSPQQRGTAIVGYAFAVVGGPTLGVSTPSDFFSNVGRDFRFGDDCLHISNSLELFRLLIAFCSPSQEVPLYQVI